MTRLASRIACIVLSPLAAALIPPCAIVVAVGGPVVLGAVLVGMSAAVTLREAATGRKRPRPAPDPREPWQLDEWDE